MTTRRLARRVEAILREASEMPEYPSYVKAEAARANGIPPDAFEFAQWPVSNVRVHHPEYGMSSRIALCYRCDIPADTPLDNQYDEAGRKLPDPVGLCLSRVKFELRDADTDEKLDVDQRLHVNGDVLGYVTEALGLFRRMPRGGPAIRVRLRVYPLFYYLNEEGGANLGYANMGHRGYFAGEKVYGDIFTLALDLEGNLLLNGEPAPPDPEPEKTPEEIELEAQMERERIAREAEQREIREREERQRREIAAARRQIDSRRGDYATAEEWLLGVLFDKSLPFEVRKRCYGIAAELGIDLEAVRKERAARREAERKRQAEEYRRRQAEEREKERMANEIEAVKQFLWWSGAMTDQEKLAVLRKIYDDDRYDRFDPAVEIVAKELGLSLA